MRECNGRKLAALGLAAAAGLVYFWPRVAEKLRPAARELDRRTRGLRDFAGRMHAGRLAAAAGTAAAKAAVVQGGKEAVRAARRG